MLGMATLILEIRAQQLSQIGIDHDEPIDPDMPPAQLKRLMNDINAVGQWLFLNAPASWFHEKPKGSRFRAPQTLSSVTTTDGSKVIACVSFAEYMHGCTVRLFDEWNRIFQTGASTWELMIPANQTTAAGTLTLYHDCLNLTDASIAINRVILDDYWELQPANNVADLEIPFWNSLTTTVTPPQVAYGPFGRDRQIDTPRQYGLESSQLYGGSYVPLLRVNPLPNSAYPLHWQERQKFTKVASWDDSRTTIVPHEYHESIFMPLVLERLALDPGFQGDKASLVAQGNQARADLAILSAPQRKPVRVDKRRGMVS